MTRSGSSVRYHRAVSIAVATLLIFGAASAASVVVAQAQQRAYPTVSGVSGGSGGSGGAPNLTLTPATAANPVGTSHTATAALTGVGGVPLAGVAVSFTVTGVNNVVSPRGGTCVPVTCMTDTSGKVTFTYFDANGGGTDTISASATIEVCEDSTETVILGVNLSDSACMFLHGTNIRTTVHDSASKTWVDECGDDTAAPLDAHGRPILPTDATDVTTTTVMNHSDGSVAQLYPSQNTTTDLWYPNVPCDWSIGGTLPSVNQLNPSATAPCPVDVADPADDPGATNPPAPCPGAATALAKVDPNLTLAQLQTQLGQIANQQEITFTPLLPGTVLPSICPTKGAAPAGPAAPSKCRVNGTAPPLNASLPFGGRDIIFVHGFETQPFMDVAQNRPLPKWPPANLAARNAFYSPGGYWKSQANSYWANDINQYLHGDYGNNRNGAPSPNATNRYMTVAWAPTQRLFVGAHAMLSQIAKAMSTGTGPNGQPLVINNTGQGGIGGFCANGCVIISHSTGGPLTDVAMDLAKRTTVAGQYQTQFGNLGWISDHIRAHIALHGAFAGSGLATAAFLVETLNGVATACKLVIAIIDLFGPKLSGCNGLVALLATIPRSSLLDLIPEVMQLRWGSWIDDTPTPTITVAGANPHADGIDSGFLLGIPEAVPIRPLVKWLLLPGLDDGVVAMNSQCANPNLAGLEAEPLREASSYTPYSPFFPIKTFDMGVPLDRSIPSWIAQNVDPTLSLPNLPADNPRPVSEGCTPYVAPDGMVQPMGSVSTSGVNVGGIVLGGTDPLNRFANHFSFLQSTSDHYIGPLTNAQEGNGPNYITNCYLASGWFTFNHKCKGTLNDNTEEVRVITDPSVYTPPCTAVGPQCAPLVDPSFKASGMVQQFTRGKSVSFKLFGRRHTWWIWKRTYHLLKNSSTWQENDYVFTYLLR